MASVSSSTLILFIASILVAASVAGTMTNGVSRLSDALGDRSIDVSNEIRTDIDVISDPGSDAVYSDAETNVTLLLKNTGSQTLSTDPDTLDIIIDGQYATDVSTRVVGEDTDWEKGAVLEVTVNRSLGNGSHRAVVIVNDHRETFEFRV